MTVPIVQSLRPNSLRPVPDLVRSDLAQSVTNYFGMDSAKLSMASTTSGRFRQNPDAFGPSSGDFGRIRATLTKIEVVSTASAVQSDGVSAKVELSRPK